MTVKFEALGDVDVLRYEGVHVCAERDHDLDEQVRDHLANRVGEGRDRFLLDVRRLHAFYGSGFGDLHNRAWGPLWANRARVAILWNLLEPDPWRVRLDGPLAWNPDRHSLHRLSELRDVFEDEATALAHLRR